MRTFGLIGYPLTHSFSEKYFAEKFKKEGIADTVYRNFPLENIEDIKSVFAVPGINGFNVTIPFKQTIIPFLNELDRSAGEVGAVNTVLITRNASGEIIKKTGYNTDVSGFENSLKPLLKKHHTRALILGTGGSSRAVCFVLNKLGIRTLQVSRFKKDFGITYTDLKPQTILDNTLIINTTSVGMFPEVNAVPDIPYSFITSKHLLFDLIYNPAETEFLKRGREQGAATKNGLEMLQIQAEKSWEIWTANL